VYNAVSSTATTTDLNGDRILLHTMAVVANAYNMLLKLPHADFLLYALPFIPSNVLRL